MISSSPFQVIYSVYRGFPWDNCSVIDKHVEDQACYVAKIRFICPILDGKFIVDVCQKVISLVVIVDLCGILTVKNYMDRVPSCLKVLGKSKLLLKRCRVDCCSKIFLPKRTSNT